MSDVIKTADNLLDRFQRETGYWPPARSAPMEMGDPYSGREKERIVHDLFRMWGNVARLEAKVVELMLKLDQARGDIRHIREYEVKPRDEAFRELRLNDDIADCVELVLRERGLLED